MTSLSGLPSFVRSPSFVFVVIAALVVCAMVGIRYGDYVLIGDEPAFVAGTGVGAPLAWFTLGLSEYFLVYPEWSDPYTNFIRPIANAFVYLNSALFGDFYPGFYATFFLIYATGFFAALSYMRKHSNAPRAALLLFALSFALSPAFINYGLLEIPFFFDVIAAVVIFLAYNALMAGRYLFAVMLLVVSVLTKESALFAPIAAALTVLVLERRIVKALGLALVPLAIWLALRLVAFGSVTSGVAPEISIKSIVKGLLLWPAGAMHDVSWLGDLSRGELSFASSQAILGAFAIAANLLVWIVLLLAFVRLARAARRSGLAPVVDQNRFLLSAMIWLAGAVAYCVAFGLASRFGASVYLFLAIVLTMIRSHRIYGDRLRRLAGVTMAILAAAYAAIGALYVIAAAEDSDIAVTRQLYSALRQLPADTQTVYVANAPHMYSAPKFVAASQGLDVTLVYVNQFDGCGTDDGVSAYFTPRTDHVVISAPSCAAIEFPSARGIGENALSGPVGREGIGQYAFDAARIAGTSTITNEPIIDFGPQFRFTPWQDRVTFLYYDWAAGAYRSAVYGGTE